MSSYTPNYNLFRPSGSNSIDVVTDLRDNFDKIDVALKSAGSANFVISPTTPNPASLNAQYIWVQTGLGSGHDITFWYEDGL